HAKRKCERQDLFFGRTLPPGQWHAEKNLPASGVFAMMRRACGQPPLFQTVCHILSVMLKSFFDHLRAKRTPPRSTETVLVVPQTSSVEEIWSSWRYGTPASPKLESDPPRISGKDAPLRSMPETSPKSDSKPDPTSAKPAERVSQ